MRIQRKTFVISISILISISLFSCQQFSESVEVQRNPMVKAKVNGESWQTREYVSILLGKTVYYEDVNDATGVLYERLHLSAFNNAQYPEQLQFILDVKDLNNMVGEYTTTYTANGGVHDIVWIDQASSADFYPLFSICDSFKPTTKITIERQSTSEKLISGTFEMTLCERTNGSNTLVITQGEFKDIYYDPKFDK
jgi:hypothetical protein